MTNELKASEISKLIESLRVEAAFQADRFGRRILADELSEAADVLEKLKSRAQPESKPLSNFDHITQSPEELAKFTQGLLPL